MSSRKKVKNATKPISGSLKVHENRHNLSVVCWLRDKSKRKRDRERLHDREADVDLLRDR